MSDPLYQLIKKLEKQYNVNLWLTLSGNDMILEKIIVPKSERNQGIGSKVMQELLDYADKNKFAVYLTPSTDFGGSKAKLTKFYKRFGFKKNKGYERQETMVREVSEIYLPSKGKHVSRATNFVKSRQQKTNWWRNRFRIQTGINRYHRRNAYHGMRESRLNAVNKMKRRLDQVKYNMGNKVL
jgi:predicted GNAT family N-acyltransferase